MPSVPSPLVSAAALRTRCAGQEPPVLLDVRWSLTGPHGREDYDRGHLPGAVFVDLDTELSSARTATSGRHPLPDVAALQEVLRAAGVSGSSVVVLYDARDATSAARGWWVLRWAGLTDVAVLDGGLAAWTAAGGEVTTDVPSPPRGDVALRAGALPVLDADAAATLARTGLLLDARAPERYRGEVEPVDPVAGHVPGAVNAPTAANVGPDGTFLPADELRARFTALGADGVQVGVYCGSGVTAAHELLALDVAGLTGTLYPGSWSEWVTNPERPVATGAETG
ncbi:sulfurtransferase [Kineococcus rubinsiae]|uniref:sulfurtransferase n=1 Tax=Kineococcus rubinsiae TaxID=2609562 RepID=UPI0014321682|nr:sulfurtransferase [Kineococcus rubinsiae]NIZ89997.1 sulfurtransferase [Kineococcus rubinsiae]